ncbi:hypothetical protein RMSM_04234 [Rhodopirellula maiorica SM1]|uniref:Uncharacterized protein n=1 Tax=Rhodopirellula maiorica SM1 TaxID=1265738 RepID=M5RHT6_9BACT|nr:hypothetical protein RMSM_04234 [Rhodopirellula maiorica SM1]
MQSGELDNRKLGWTVGWLQLDGVADRLQLKLVGNCHPDLAGWKFRIHRVSPEPEEDFDDDDPPDYTGISVDQSGHVGDITADQMIKQHEMSNSELARRLMSGEKPPFTLRKCLYLEWFSNHNGRVVVQSTRLEVERIGEQAFELTEEQWIEQSRQNRDEMNFFMTQLGDALDNAPPDDSQSES